ncbi:MAG: nucleoside deaminase [Tetragenococcus sp.]|nr:nucleoside deaminase [Tetragenococcus sp.]
MIYEADRKYLERCVELAERALIKGDAPFGSLLVSREGKILFEDHNRISGGDNTRHPEFEIAKWATNHLNEAERREAVVYTSGEHCSMCASAHGLVGLGRTVYASSTEQLETWNKEMGIEKGRVKGLSIQEVIADTPVDGPDEILSEKVRELHYRYHNKELK